MTHILRIDSSSRNAAGGSHSRRIADRIVSQLQTRTPETAVITRDLIATPLPHISNDTITGFHTPAGQMTDTLRDATALSDALIDELAAAQAVVLSVPIYNFSVPSALKAWIDHITRMGRTFTYEDGAFRPLLNDRPVYVVYAYGAGGYAPGGPFESYDFMRPYLSMLLNFIGLTSVTDFMIEATTADPETVAAEHARTQAAIDAHFGARRMDRPTLHWISGSPPAWRVMLALTLKGIGFESRRLDHKAGENRSAEYLSINPSGQVPTLVSGDITLRESIAILAWLDRAYPDRPIWGQDVKSAAQVWQDVMVMEGDLRLAVSQTARALLRCTDHDGAALAALAAACDAYAETLDTRPFLGGASPMASDIWLYPALHWIARGVALADDPPPLCKSLTSSRPPLRAWMDRMATLPGVRKTYPPHWRTPPVPSQEGPKT